MLLSDLTPGQREISEIKEKYELPIDTIKLVDGQSISEEQIAYIKSKRTI